MDRIKDKMIVPYFCEASQFAKCSTQRLVSSDRTEVATKSPPCLTEDGICFPGFQREEVILERALVDERLSLPPPPPKKKWKGVVPLSAQDDVHRIQP